jgi:hypothetical protein
LPPTKKRACIFVRLGKLGFIFDFFCFGPGLEQPLSIDLQCSHRPLVSLNDYFSFSVMRSKIDLHAMDYGLETLGSYYWKEAWFNAVEEEIWVQ